MDTTTSIEKTEFIIDRSKWRCGDDSINAKGLGDTALLNEQGYMCCLGQISDQLGFKENELLNWAEPAELSDGNGSNILFDEHGENTQLSINAIYINDDSFTSISEKEKALKDLFKNEGLKIKFIGKSVKYKKDE